MFQQNIKQPTCLTFRTPSRASSKLTRRIIAPDVTIWRSETGSSQTSPPLSQLLPRVSLCAVYNFLTTEYKEQTAGSFSSKEWMGTSAQSLTLYNMPVFLVNRICRLRIKGTALPIKATFAQLSKKEHLAVTRSRCFTKLIQLHLYKPPIQTAQDCHKHASQGWRYTGGVFPSRCRDCRQGGEGSVLAGVHWKHWARD